MRDSLADTQNVNAALYYSSEWQQGANRTEPKAAYGPKWTLSVVLNGLAGMDLTPRSVSMVRRSLTLLGHLEMS